MSTKTLLKLSKEKIQKKDYEGARDAAERVLEFEPSNYTAHVFLALAASELQDYEKSENLYKAAIELEPSQLLARQGLLKLYEKRKDSDGVLRSLGDFADIYLKSEDVTKLAETLQRVVEIRRAHGTKLQLVQALMAVLPGSPYYPLLSTLPEPDSTNPTATTTTFWAQTAIHDSYAVLEEVLAIVEAEEKARFAKEFSARRTRLGAPKPAIIRKELDREICESSKLPDLYNEILNHPKTSEDVRRETEAKLIEFKQRQLHAVPSTDERKAVLRDEYVALIDGVVLIKRPNESAWSQRLQWQDWEKFENLDQAFLKSYVDLFPDSALSNVIKGYLLYHGVDPTNEKQEEGKNAADQDPTEAGVDVLLAIPSESLDSIFANRVVSEVYADLEEYESSANLAKAGLKHLAELEGNIGMKLNSTRVGLQTTLSTSLVHLNPPKNHDQAMSLILEILSVSPSNIAALMSQGFILQSREDWQGAMDSFGKVVLTDPLSYQALRASEESAWCESRLGLFDPAITHFQAVLQTLEGHEGRELEVARCLWRLGQTHWDYGGGHREQAYVHFIRALKMDSSYAPAFTSLGLYYLTCAQPADPVRASKCFQKAFELDSRETVAARHLAEGFADEREWDLVEVVVRRTIEGEGGALPGKEVEGVSRDVTRNAWAWKALGVVELNQRNYPEAINAFQAALRAEPNDHVLWLRLGEAYGKAGRYAAALKALEHSHELDPTDWLAPYFIAEAQQGVGLYGEAIQALTTLAQQRPEELGIISSLASAYLAQGISELESGFISRAEGSFLMAITEALKFLSTQSGLRSIGWKIITDATFHLSEVSSFHDEGAVVPILKQVQALLPAENARLKGVLSPPDFEGTIVGADALKVSILSAEYRLSLSPSNNDASAWHDIGIGLYAWSIQGNASDALSALITKCLAEAVQREPSSATYWAALGAAYFTSNPRSAQHSFIKALEIDNKNAELWSNLGLLYLYHEDVELAREALLRAQVLDPDCALAWVGQALIAAEEGDVKGEMSFLSHAATLDRPVPEADYTLSLRVFAEVNKQILPRAKAVDHLLPIFFLLNRFCSRQPDNAAGLHLFALVCERLGHKELAKELVNRGMRILERIYEEKEDPVVERQFMIVNATLARLLLATGEPEDSMITFETVLGLLQEEDQLKGVLETQAKLGIGMGQAVLRDLQEAILSLQYAQGIAPEDDKLRAQCSILLAQTLWCTRNAEYCEMAKEELLKLISDEARNLAAINVLAGLGILTKDEGLVDAAVSEIISLPPDERVALDHDGNVDYLLIQYLLSQGNLQGAISTAQKSLFFQPSNIVKSNTLAGLLLKMRYPNGTLALLSGHERELKGGSTTLILSAVSNLLLGTEESLKKALQSAQRAVMICPSKAICWQVLACVRKSIEGQNTT